MRKATWFPLALLLVLLQNYSAFADDSDIQIVGPSAITEAEEVAGVLRRGADLEEQHRWGEALTLYEDALRAHPGQDAGLGDRQVLAKIHYDLGRRYHDNSFVRSLTTLGEREAIALYGELLLKIQSHYVTEPKWQSVVQRGSAALEVALTEDVFAKRNLRDKSDDECSTFCTQLAQAMAQRPIRTRQDAIDAVTAAARLGKQKLGLPATAVVLEYVSGATGALDEYSAFLTGDQLNDVYSQIEGNFVGLGIELKADNGVLLIVKVITGSPAERAGIKSGDRITSVGGRTTTSLSTDQAANLLQGEEGSVVEVVVVSPNRKPRTLTVRREHVDVPSVDEIKIVDRELGVGYFRLNCFQKTTSRDIDAALWKLHRDGMKSLIMDLRGNPGGLLTAAVEVVDKFVEDGVIVTTRGRSSLEDYSYTAHKAGTWRVPLVVLIDADSASASEIFAGAIRDHRRGTIVGQRSYGKGSVQGIFPLTQVGAGIRLTTAKFYSPSGRPISKVGVTPDVVVRSVAKPIDGSVAEPQTAALDIVLNAGIQAARQQMAKR